MTYAIRFDIVFFHTHWPRVCTHPIFDEFVVLVLFAPADYPHRMVSRSRTVTQIRTSVHTGFVHEKIFRHGHDGCKQEIRDRFHI